MPEKGHGCALEPATLGLCLEDFYLSSESENCSEGFQKNIYQPSRCVFKMLMQQNEVQGSLGLFWSLLLFDFYLESVWI